MDTASHGWLLLGAVSLGVGAVIISFLMASLRREDHHHGSVALVIPIIAASAYFAMSQGQLLVPYQPDHTSYLPRYIDWSITTPLLLLSLVWVGLPPAAGHASFREHFMLIGSAILADFYMIVTGVFADLSPAGPVRWAWYILSCGAFLVVLYMIWGRWRAEIGRVGGAAQLQAYTSLATLLTVLWLLYPVVWVVGSTGLKIIPVGAETGAYTILDVVAKVGFGIGVLLAIKRLAAVGRPAFEESTVEATTPANSPQR